LILRKAQKISENTESIIKQMNTHTLALTLSSVLLSIALIQCSSPTPGNPQEEVVMPIQGMETKPMQVMETSPIPEPTAVARPTLSAESEARAQPSVIVQPTVKPKPVPTAQPKTTTQPKVAVEPMPTAEPEAPTQPIPTAEPSSIPEPTLTVESIPAVQAEPIAEPSLTSSACTLKLLQAAIEGSSTLHSWESQITEVTGKGSFQFTDQLLTAIQDVEISIAVKSIKSKEGAKMDDKTYETFASDEHPFIKYAFTDAVVKRGASQMLTVEASGTLSMAGTSRPVSLVASGKELPNGDLHLTLSHKIKMTDYNMEPPVMFLGTIKVGDEVSLKFDFELTRLQK
jgi:polyisoprenoid-binding protein YceI